jgi:hypothetical protein
MPRPDGTPTAKELADVKRAQKRRAEAATMGHQGRRRREWEASPEGQARLTDASTHFGTRAAPAQVYEVRGWGETFKGARHFEQQLPGLENPDALPTPPRWEDLPDEEKARTERGLKLHAGADIDFMTRSFGAQLDQAYLRAERNTPLRTAAIPHTRDFYTETHDLRGEKLPRAVMHDSAADVGLPFGQYTAISAITSPQTKFHTRGRTGDRYPNDETARSTVEQARSGVPVAEGTTGPRRDMPGGKNEGYPANARKAIDAVQQMDAGVNVPELKSRWKEDRKAGAVVPREEPTPMFGPKTGPYHNSWLLDTPDYFVSDVHSGGGALLPHLSSHKGGGDSKGKSEREIAIERTPNFHSAADYAVRQAIESRGLTSIRQAQASQWGEEQIQRKEANSRLQGSKTEAQAYGHLSEPPPVDRHQGYLDYDRGTAVSGMPVLPTVKKGSTLPREKLESNWSEQF